MRPVVIVNFKCYEKGTAEDSVRIVKACSKYGAWCAVQAVDILRVKDEGVIFAQHADDKEYGAHTGAVTPIALKRAGATGTLLNHTEKPIDKETLARTVSMCKKAGLKTVICSSSVEEAENYLMLNPDYIAVEIPELIGGDISVTDADPAIIVEEVKRLGSNVLVGAGVSSGEDLKKAVELGAAGVLLASAIVKKTDDPQKALSELYSSIDT